MDCAVQETAPSWPCRSSGKLVVGVPPQRSRFEPRSSHVGFVVGKAALGARFLRVLRFPLSLIPPTAERSSSSTIRGWYNRPNSIIF
jgi:hypothetical protein